jgi:hypothetical protein
MPEVVVQGVRFAYETAGDGFPLVLAPGPQGRRAVWLPYMPLLGELCRVIAYECHEREQGLQHGEPHTSTGAVDMLGTFLAVLGLERVYLASQPVGWPMALHFALQHPACLEGLVLIGAHDVEMDTVRGVMPLQTRLHELTVPTLVLLEEQAHAAFPYAEVLTERLPHCTQIVVPDSSLSPSAPSPALRLGHAMMQFLLHCERQRNLVRGASFLL